MLNKCEFIGRLTADVDLRFTQGGTAVGNFTVACGEKWKDKNTGEKKEVTEFVKCVAWDKVGTLVSEYLHKGSLCYVAGPQQTRKWEKDGVTHYTTEINVKEVKFLDSKQSDTSHAEHAQHPATKPDHYTKQGGNPPDPESFDDDSIPF